LPFKGQILGIYGIGGIIDFRLISDVYFKKLFEHGF